MYADELFKLPCSLPYDDFFQGSMAAWEWVQQIKKPSIQSHFAKWNLRSQLIEYQGSVFIHPSVELPPYGSIQGPCYIGAHCQLRPGVYIRGNVIAGEHSVLGNACEFKNCMLLDHVQVPHFNYVGDSILGNHSHLGAGVIVFKS